MNIEPIVGKYYYYGDTNKLYKCIEVGTSSDKWQSDFIGQDSEVYRFYNNDMKLKDDKVMQLALEQAEEEYRNENSPYYKNIERLQLLLNTIRKNFFEGTRENCIICGLINCDGNCIINHNLKPINQH